MTFYALVAHLLIVIMDHPLLFFFFFNDTATTEIYTLSLHDALPIFRLTSHGSGCEAASIMWATRVCARIVVMSLLHTLRKSHHEVQASWWKVRLNGVLPEVVELIPFDA